MTSSAAVVARGSRRRWVLLVTVSAGLLMIVLDNSILYTALPTLTEELRASSSQSLWIINAYPVVMAGLLLGSGTLGDRVGHRRMFLIGLIVFGGASLFAAFAPTAWALIGARALLAVGAATMMPATLALIATTFQDERERNIAIGIWGSLSTVGMALGPIIGGALLQAFWWGSVFLINVPIAVAAIVATVLLAPANDPNPAKRWDFVSSAWALVGLVGAVIAVKQAAHPPQNWWVVAAAVAASIIGFVCFQRRQRQLPEPLLDVRIFRNPAFSGGVLAAAVATFVIGGIQLITTQRYQLVEGFTPLQSGLLVAIAAVGALPMSIVGGAFLHRIGLRIMITGGLTVTAAGSVCIMLTAGTSMPGMIVGLLLIGVGIGSATSVASTAIVSNATPDKAGMASSVEEVSYEFGSLTAVAILGSLISFIYSLVIHLPSGSPAAARDSITSALSGDVRTGAIASAAHDAYATGYTVTMAVIIVIAAAGAIVTARLLRRYGIGSTISTPEDADAAQ